MGKGHDRCTPPSICFQVATRRHYESKRGIEHRSRPRRLCGRLRLGGRLQDPEKDGHDVSVVQNPTCRWRTTSRSTKRVSTRRTAPSPRRPFLRRRRDHRSRQRPEGRGACLHRGLCSDEGESVAALIKDPPPGAPVPPILPPQDGYLFLDKAKFPAVLRRRRRPGPGRVHGRLAGAVGRRRRSAARSASRRGRPSRAGTWSHRRRMIPPPPSADGQARGLDGRRGHGQPRHLCVSTRVVAEFIAKALPGTVGPRAGDRLTRE